jgi:hypothetical protein
MEKQRSLKNVLIYPEFQLRLITIITVISLIAPLLIYFFQYSAFQDQIENGQMMNLSEAHPYYVFYYDFQQRMLTVLFTTLLISFLTSLVVGLYVSHKIAGPLIKMRKHFEAIGRREVDEHAIYFRDRDYFRDLAEAYNLKFEPKKPNVTGDAV